MLIAALCAGKLADAESMMALKDLMNRLNCDNTRHEALPADMDADTRGSYVANSGIPGIEESDCILLIGTNPRVESPVYNARIRKMFLSGTKVRAGCQRLVACSSCSLTCFSSKPARSGSLPCPLFSTTIWSSMLQW